MGLGRWFRRRDIEPYWYLIILFWLAAGSLYLLHLARGTTYGRVAFTIPLLNLDVYWYGLIIMAGIILGGYVVSRLVLHRARTIFAGYVPRAVRKRSLASLSLPDELQAALAKKKINRVGDLLFLWGWQPERLGLDSAGREAVGQALKKAPGIPAEWLEDAPWRPWDPDHVWSGLVWCLVLAIIGARLYHLLTPSPSMAAFGIHSPWDYFRHPMEALNLRQGGLGIYGGIAGGFLGLWLYAYRQRLPALAWADLAVIGLALGQAVGRWANFVNQELYGRPTDLPWAVAIDPGHRLPGFIEFSHFHPAFLYESVWNFLLFALLLFLFQRHAGRLKNGDLVGVYLIGYAVGRILLETVRLDSRMANLGPFLPELPIATLVSLAIALPAAVWLAVRHYKRS